MRFFNTEGPVRPGDHYGIPPLDRMDVEELPEPGCADYEQRPGGFPQSVVLLEVPRMWSGNCVP